jgi:uncharacterized protein YbaR (Trm112 family)
LEEVLQVRVAKDQVSIADQTGRHGDKGPFVSPQVAARRADGGETQKSCEDSSKSQSRQDFGAEGTRRFVTLSHGDWQSTLCYPLRASLKGVNARMAIDPDLLEILVCPQTKGELELVQLPDEVRQQLVEKYREHFRDDEPVVEQALYSPDSQLVYPIVSDIPIMLVDEALPASTIGR